MALLSLFDPLYCEEDNFDLEEEQMRSQEPMPPPPPVSDHQLYDQQLLSSAAADHEWAEVLRSLVEKERETSPEFLPDGGNGKYIRSVRSEVVAWVGCATSRHAFSAITALLAVNYLDRCFLCPSAAGGLRLHGDKPWMGRLAAVACLSIAAKVEETFVPMLLDLQVSPLPPAAAVAASEDENAYVFEAKTLRRMELLVLSALGWRMNPVTPLSFIYHLVPRLWPNAGDDDSSTCVGGAAAGAAVERIRELVKSCETALLSVIADWRWVRYPASIWAAAALLHASETGGGSGGDEVRSLIALLKVPKGKMEECYRLIVESMTGGGGMVGQKRKHSSSISSYYDHLNLHCPPSPNGVIGSCFSCESSCESWAMWQSTASVSSSPEIQPFKRKPRGSCCISIDGFRDEKSEKDEVFSLNFG